MKIYMLSLILSLVTFTAMAANDSISTMNAPPVSPSSMKLNQGDMQIGGSFNLSNSYGTNYFNISPQAEYFFFDRLSLGGLFSYYSASGSTSYNSYGLGPSGSFYFYKYGTAAFFAGQRVSFQKNSGDSKIYTSGGTSLGVKFFVVPNVAFGVTLATNYRLDDSDTSTYNNLGGDFSFFF